MDDSTRVLVGELVNDLVGDSMGDSVGYSVRGLAGSISGRVDRLTRDNAEVSRRSYHRERFRLCK